MTATVFSHEGKAYQVVNTDTQVIVSQVFIPQAPVVARSRPEELAERNAEIKALFKAGATREQLAREFELGRSRVNAILRS